MNSAEPMPEQGPFPGDAVAVHRETAREALVVVSAEHASDRLPAGWSWPEGDRRLAGTHWASDLGAAELALELARAAGAAAVLASFTRLLVDPNRPLDSPSLFLARADGAPVALNQRIDAADRARRLRYWHAYHHALGATVQRSRAPIVLAIHSFTPVYEGVARTVELGVLFDREQVLGERLASALAATGLDVRLNEPYSGRAGLIDSAERHARAHGRRALELELRQDLAVEPAVRVAVVAIVVRALRELARA